jgi:hypothetical protein
MTLILDRPSLEDHLEQRIRETEAASARARARVAEARGGGAAETSDALSSALNHHSTVCGRLAILHDAAKLVRSVRRRGLVHFIVSSDSTAAYDASRTGVHAFVLRALDALSRGNDRNDLQAARDELNTIRQVIRAQMTFYAIIPFVLAGMFWFLAGYWGGGLLLVAWFAPTLAIFRSGASATIERLPGSRLRVLLDFVCTAKSFRGVFEPIIADMQDEYVQAVAAGRHQKARWVRLRGYWGLLEAAGFMKLLNVWDLILKLKWWP